MAEASIVGRAVVHVSPVYTGSQRDIARQVGPDAKRAGRQVGKDMGEAISDGVSEETKKLQARVEEYAKKASAAQDKVAAATKRTTAATRAEADAQDAVRLAAAKLADVRAKGNASSGATVAAEQKLAKAFRQSKDAAESRARAESDLTNSSRDLREATVQGGLANNDLVRNLRRVSTETQNTERNTGRLAAAFSRAFDRNNSPLRNMADNINRDGKRIDVQLRSLADNIGNSGTRGGRAFTRAFGLVSAGLAILPPLAGGVGSAFVAAAGAAITLSDSLTDLVGVAALAPAGLIAVAAAGGVLRTAFAGMGEALKTATDTSKKIAGNAALDAMAIEDAANRITEAEADAAKASIDGARQISDAEEAAARTRVQAARRVEDAQQALADATQQAARDQEQALRGVADAEREVERTNRRVTESQRDLNDARKEAADRLKDLKDQLTDAALSERDAAIELEEAQLKLAAGRGEGLDPRSLAMRKLVLDVDQAAFALKEAKERSAELGEENAQAAAEGVEGNRRVRDAVQSVADAQQEALDAAQGLRDAERELTETQVSGRRAVREAERDLADARTEAAQDVKDAEQGVADARADAAEAQEDAAKQVAEAYRAMTREQVRQADAVADAMADANDAMAKLSPNAQRAAKSILGVYNRLLAIKNVIQENFFAGFVAPFELMADKLLPQVERGAGRIATALGDATEQLMTSLTEAFDNGVLEELLDGVTNIIRNLIPAIDPLVKAFVTMARVGMPYLEAMATSIADAADRFNDFIQTAATNGDLDRWIQDGLQGFQDIGGIIIATTGVFNALAEAARAGGIDVTLESIRTGLEGIRKEMEGPVFQDTMSTIFAGAAAGAKGLSEGLKGVGDAFVKGGPAFADFLRLGGEILGTFIGGFANALADPTFGKGLIDFMTALRDGTKEVVDRLPGMTDALGRLLTDLAPIFEALGPTLVTVITGIADGLEKILNFLGPLLTKMAESPAIVGLFIAAFAGTAALAALATFAANIATIVTVAGKLPGILTAITTAAPLAWAAITGPVGLAVIAVVGLIAVTALLADWFFNRTQVGQDFISSMVPIGLKTKNYFERAWLPGMKGIFADLVLGFEGKKRELAEKFLFLQTKSSALATWWGLRFAEMKLSTKNTTDEIERKFDAFGQKVEDFWHGIWEGLKDFGKTVVDIFKQDFERLRKIASAPIKFVVEDLLNNGLIKGLNSILPDSKHIKPIPAPEEGWRKGGYTGEGDPAKIAGPVHHREFVFDEAATAAAGPERLAAMAGALKSKGLSGLSSFAQGCNHANAATIGRGNMGGFFEGNAANIRRHGAYYMNVARGMDAWNFPGAARMWDGAAGVKVRTGFGKHQGQVYPRERGGGILGYTTGNNIDMSPMWMRQLGAAARRTVAAHEIGHALGLPHNSLRSIMQPNLANMASGPTGIDIANLQALYPGGSGKAGSGEAAENPLLGMLGGLLKKMQVNFPGGGVFVDVAKSLFETGFNQMFSIIEDVKNGILNIGGTVVNAIKDFFGGGGQADDTALFRDQGGYLPPGLSTVRNNTGENEYILNPQQWRDMHTLATTRVGGGSDFPGEVNLLLADGTAFTTYVDRRADNRIEHQTTRAVTRRRGR